MQFLIYQVISIRHRRHDTEHHNHDDTQTEEDELMPGYMRRPICAACDRNVKIAASSESLNKKNKSSSSSLSSLNNSGSRRSSISRNTSPQQTMNAKRNKKKVLSVTINSEEEETILLTPTASLSFSLTSDEDDEVDEQGHDKVILTVSPRSLSPSSPIPTRTQMNIPEQSSLVKEDTIQSKEEAPKTAVVTRPIRQNYSHYDKPELMRSIQNDIYESKQRILDTLQREEIKDYENILTTQLQLMDKLECLIQPSLLLPATPEESIQITSWQTKLEYGVARMKWNMSQWMGTVVGTGDIEDQDFDIHGYTKNVVISGVCVTTEPGLLPKSLQKFYKEEDSEVICHKYVIQLSRDNRLSSFQLMDKKDWISDDTTKQCEFSCINDKGPIVKTVRCSTEFGVFERKHHCRR
ncbi:hypothetical protein BDB01DRAFT_33805 [Pilobolus umbonatus]|nr:hypothetical protein BDB01DRAFT_33805 [Pilobolus umbonatus]